MTLVILGGRPSRPWQPWAARGQPCWAGQSLMRLAVTLTLSTDDLGSSDIHVTWPHD